MARNVQITDKPVLDTIDARSIASGAPAKIGDLWEIDQHQWALFSRFGNPPFWIACNASGAEELTLELPSPPGVQFFNLYVLAAGDGGLVDNGWGVKVGKDYATILITSDKDANGTNLKIKSKPQDYSSSSTALVDAVLVSTDKWTADATTANEDNRKIRTEDNDNNKTKVHRTIRIAVPSGVTLYGVGFEPIFLNL